VLESLVPIEREVCTPAGLWYLARIQPYRTVDDLIDGVVLTLSDVTERVEAIASRKARRLAEAIVDAMPEPLLVLDASLQVLSANQAFYREFGLRRCGHGGAEGVPDRRGRVGYPDAARIAGDPPASRWPPLGRNRAAGIPRQRATPDPADGTAHRRVGCGLPAVAGLRDRVGRRGGLHDR
jgi:PAS domain-containing protein